MANYRKAKDSLRAGVSLIEISDLQKREADYFGAETAMVDAEVLMKNQDKSYKIYLYNSLGLVYRELFDYESSLKYFRKAIELEDDAKAKNYAAINVALIHIDNKQYDRATTLLDSVNKNVSESDIQLRSKILSNKGFALAKSGDGSGLNLLLEAKTLTDPSDLHSMISVDLRLAEVLAGENSAKAKRYAKDAWENSKKIKNPDDQIKALELLVSTSAAASEKQLFFSELVSVSDSIRKVRHQAKNQFAKLRYDFQSAEEALLKTRAESAENKLVAEKSQQRSNLLLITLVFSIMIFLLVGYIFRARHVREKIKEVYETEVRLSKKVLDELANDVYNVMTFTDLQKIESANKERIMSDLDNLYQRTRNISRMNATVETGEKFPEHLKEMISDFQSSEINVMLKGFDAIAWNELNEAKKISLFRVLQELLINMKKHSHASLCLLSFENKSNKIEIVCSDNGVGISQNELFLKNGLQNAENRIRQVRGTIIFDENQQRGFKATITIPA